MDSLENPNAAYLNCAEESKFIMTRLMSGRYSLKPNLRKRKFYSEVKLSFTILVNPTYLEIQRNRIF